MATAVFENDRLDCFYENRQKMAHKISGKELQRVDKATFSRHFFDIKIILKTECVCASYELRARSLASALLGPTKPYT